MQRPEEHPLPWSVKLGWEQTDPGVYILDANEKVVYAEFGNGGPDRGKGSHDVPLNESVANFLVAAANASTFLSKTLGEAGRRKMELAVASIALGVAYDRLTDMESKPQGPERDGLRQSLFELLEMAMVDIDKSQQGIANIDLLKYADLQSSPKPGERLKGSGGGDDGSMFGLTGRD